MFLHLHWGHAIYQPAATPLPSPTISKRPKTQKDTGLPGLSEVMTTKDSGDGYGLQDLESWRK